MDFLKRKVNKFIFSMEETYFPSKIQKNVEILEEKSRSLYFPKRKVIYLKNTDI